MRIARRWVKDYFLLGTPRTDPRREMVPAPEIAVHESGFDTSLTAEVAVTKQSRNHFLNGPVDRACQLLIRTMVSNAGIPNETEAIVRIEFLPRAVIGITLCRGAAECRHRETVYSRFLAVWDGRRSAVQSG